MGSTDFESGKNEAGIILREWIKFVNRNFDIKILGVGAGHQVIAEAFGGKTSKLRDNNDTKREKLQFNKTFFDLEYY